ncbi:NifB/NifX family molybdenum-iron cluster-binding protein [Vibrio hannami]|uniref:NifB/NifX family molybdenum-iron cluster-binding protein n=1 Tax=Vibrio hannami TaxID=2717094 RepID=UPI00240F6A3F|nr:NifB/NifX family molybdenum-iron cluster-binding protein [Vibrio hannami]MDG3087250.1 NifB/NifX family molybdenum-iron cluster-binding protein [Vibrio hannami]
MIYAVPNNRDNVANHFIKAPQFSFIDEENSLIQNVTNPAAGNSSCSEKSAAIKMLKEMKTDAVIVRNIGERALGKLLSAGIRVFMVTTQTPLSAAANSPMVELTDTSQGRPSHNHHKKGGCSHGEGGSCCSSKQDGSHSGCGCNHGHSHQHHGRSTLNDSGILKHITNNNRSGKKRAMRFSLSGISSLRSINK